MNQLKLKFLADNCVNGDWHTIKVVPVGKPRMTQKGLWKPVVKRYYYNVETFKLWAKDVPRKDVSVVSWIAYFPFPKSYTNSKRDSLRGQPHQLKPDRDNIDKFILDSLFSSDQRIHAGLTAKYWDDGKGARIELLVK